MAEGGTATISFCGQSDPSAADTATGFTYRYACDGVTLGPPTADASAACALIQLTIGGGGARALNSAGFASQV